LHRARRGRSRSNGRNTPSYHFWADDKLEIPNFGLPETNPQPRILISGGGDGALQDFLRVAFPNKTAGQVYDLLIPDPALRAETELRLFAAEDEFRRAWGWSEDDRLACEILQTLHG
jgi:hypothetical protein